MLQVNRAAILAPNGQTFEEECWLLQHWVLQNDTSTMKQIFKGLETHLSIVALCKTMKVIENCVIVEISMEKVNSVKSLL